MILASAMKTVSLAQLLSSCMDASRQGCEIIQDFHRKSMAGEGISGSLKVGGEIKSVVTQADFDAQARIIGALRECWGDSLRIIGEEDDDDAKPSLDGPPLDLGILSRLGDNILDKDIPLGDVTLFVDPLDGTREFVEGRLQNVACLIGISRNHRPIAGVIGLPFPEGSREIPVRIHYAIGDQPGSAGSWPAQTHYPEAAAAFTETITILTGDSKDPVLVNATNVAKSLTDSPIHLLIGGTAAKLRIVATQPNSLAILHFKTELWDTCSPQALIESNGGMVTDLFGAPLVHSPERPFGNVFGVVASSGEPEVTKLHHELCARMRADTQSVHKIFGRWIGPVVPIEPQAMDIARDLDGVPFSREMLERMIMGEGADRIAKLRSYSVSETDARRGMMSSVARFCLEWDKNGESDDLPSSVFHRRMVMADSAYTRHMISSAPHRLVRDVHSYQVETSFLTGRACTCLIKETGLRINRLYKSDFLPASADLDPKDQVESRCSLLFEGFDSTDGWCLATDGGIMAALCSLAKMHAYFWTGSTFWRKDDGQLGEELSKAVWANAGYMQSQLQGLDQHEKVAQGFEKRYHTLRASLLDIPELSEKTDLLKFGVRLECISAIVAEKAHPFNGTNLEYDRYRTLIHGDPNHANIFLRGKESEDLEVGFSGFRWIGFGLAATDVAHFISAALLPSSVSYDGRKEQVLLDTYYEILTHCLVECGVAASVEEAQTTTFPRLVLQEQYDTAIMDICRTLFVYDWRKWEGDTEPNPESSTLNACNESLDSVLWLITRCVLLLDLYESGLKENSR